MIFFYAGQVVCDGCSLFCTNCFGLISGIEGEAESATFVKSHSPMAERLRKIQGRPGKMLIKNGRTDTMDANGSVWMPGLALFMCKKKWKGVFSWRKRVHILY